MEIRKIDETISVAPQIALSDLKTLKDRGYKAVICNRPDGEEVGQIDAKIFADEAQSLGLEYVFMPVKSGQVTGEQGDEFANILSNLPKPVFAYCRSGMRSATLWGLGEMGALGRNRVLEMTREIGYDLSAVLPERAANGGDTKSVAAKAPETKTASKAKSATKKTTKKTTAKATTKTASAKSTAKKSATSKTASAKTETKKPAPKAKSTAKKTAAKTTQTDAPKVHHDIVIIGGGSAGIATAASLKHRDSHLDIAIIEPKNKHFYQPGWTFVGGGVFKAEQTERDEKDYIPNGVEWIQKSVVTFEPKSNEVTLDDGSKVSYDRLVVCPGLQLNWSAIKGLEETLGKNGVTSNYRYDLAPYTWKLVQEMKSGKAIFTQPPMPIKCAGAPQKAMYLSCSEWLDKGVLDDIQVDFCNAGGVLFGVAAYVPALMKYVEKYNANLDFFHNLVEIDGEKKIATFEVSAPDTKPKKVKMEFDMIHVCPPQSAPDFIKSSPLADAAGWVDVDQVTLQHKSFKNIWSLGDVMNAPNAKTMAAVRKQAPVVADNIIADINSKEPEAGYDGYGSCPLTVERGKIVLAEFGYGGKLLPSFPKWALDGTKPTRRAWFLKERILPNVYWDAMLKGREWMTTTTAQLGDKE